MCFEVKESFRNAGKQNGLVLVQVVIKGERPEDSTCISSESVVHQAIRSRSVSIAKLAIRAISIDTLEFLSIQHAATGLDPEHQVY
jgi:hypothetical protein